MEFKKYLLYAKIMSLEIQVRHYGELLYQFKSDYIDNYMYIQIGPS